MDTGQIVAIGTASTFAVDAIYLWTYGSCALALVNVFFVVVLMPIAIAGTKERKEGE